MNLAIFTEKKLRPGFLATPKYETRMLSNYLFVEIIGHIRWPTGLPLHIKETTQHYPQHNSIKPQHNGNDGTRGNEEVFFLPAGKKLFRY